MTIRDVQTKNLNMLLFGFADSSPYTRAYFARIYADETWLAYLFSPDNAFSIDEITDGSYQLNVGANIPMYSYTSIAYASQPVPTEVSTFSPFILAYSEFGDISFDRMDDETYDVIELNSYTKTVIMP